MAQGILPGVRQGPQGREFGEEVVGSERSGQGLFRRHNSQGGSLEQPLGGAALVVAEKGEAERRGSRWVRNLLGLDQGAMGVVQHL